MHSSVLLRHDLPSTRPPPAPQLPIPSSTTVSGPNCHHDTTDALSPVPLTHELVTTTLYPHISNQTGEPEDQLRHHGQPQDRRKWPNNVLQHCPSQPDPNPAGWCWSWSCRTRTGAGDEESEHQWTLAPSFTSSFLELAVRGREKSDDRKIKGVRKDSVRAARELRRVRRNEN